LRNCTATPGFNNTNNFAYLACGFDKTACGFNPDPLLANDAQRDPRFKSLQNFILTRNNPIVIRTAAGFN
jgi:hypothetical protein